MPEFKTGAPTFLSAVPPPPAVVVTTQEILEAQRKITETDSAIADVTARIADASKKIEKLKAGTPTPPDRKEEREDLLAEIAVGNAKDEDLAKFDRETVAVMKAHDAAMMKIRTEIAPVESVHAGLRRKAGVLAREIERLRAEHRRLCCDYLMGQAEEAGREFALAVTRAVKAADIVITLASLHIRAGGSNMIGKDGSNAIDFAPLGVASTRGTLPSLDPASRTAAADAAEEQILAQLKVEGIAMPFPETAPPRKGKAVESDVGQTWEPLRPPEPLRAADGTPLPTHAVTEE